VRREEMEGVGRARREGMRQVRAIRIGEMCRFILELKEEELPAAVLVEYITEAFPQTSLSTISLGNILTRTPGIEGRPTRDGNLWRRTLTSETFHAIFHFRVQVVGRADFHQFEHPSIGCMKTTCMVWVVPLVIRIVNLNPSYLSWHIF
jgi:hypothetical protein